MSADDETLRVYAAKHADYAAMSGAGRPGHALRRFVEALPPAGRVLDLGCGPGLDAAFMAQSGLLVDATDATPAMVHEARNRGLAARVARFDELDAVAAYDGIWASFSLLHAPRAALPDHLAAIATALKPGGHFQIGMKTGTGERRDRLGRFYTYVTRDELVALLAAAGLRVIHETETRDKGMAGSVEPGILIFSRKETADA